MHGAVHVGHVEAELGEAVAVDCHHNLGQAGGLLHVHVLGPRHLPGEAAGLLGVVGQLLQILAVDFQYHVLLGSRNQLVEAHLNGLLEAEAHAGNGGHGRGHLVGQVLAVVGRSPLRLVFEDNHQVAGFGRHGVGGNFGRADFGHHPLHLRKPLFEDAAGLLRLLDGVAQRRAGEGPHFHRKIAFGELGNELAAQGAEQ